MLSTMYVLVGYSFSVLIHRLYDITTKRIFVCLYSPWNLFRRFNNINSNVAFCAEILVLVLLYFYTDIVYYVKE